MEQKHFRNAPMFRAWLDRHHARARELGVVFFKKATGKGGLTYPEALDEALCYGWIDGVRRSLDAERYVQRFTPRKARSIWSLVNVRHARRLISQARMHESGLLAFEARNPGRTGVYSFENRPVGLPAPLARVFRGSPQAWKFWRAQPPGYRRTATWWIVSAKREETRLRRLAHAIACSARGRRIDVLSWPP